MVGIRWTCLRSPTRPESGDFLLTRTNLTKRFFTSCSGKEIGGQQGTNIKTIPDRGWGFSIYWGGEKEKMVGKAFQASFGWWLAKKKKVPSKQSVNFMRYLRGES